METEIGNLPRGNAIHFLIRREKARSRAGKGRGRRSYVRKCANSANRAMSQRPTHGSAWIHRSLKRPLAQAREAEPSTGSEE
jgi:hypothetical protein